MTNKNKELQGIIIEEILNQKGSRVSCDDCVIIAKKVTERFGSMVSVDGVEEVKKYVDYLRLTPGAIDDRDEIFELLEVISKSLGDIKSIQPQPPKAEPVDVRLITGITQGNSDTDLNNIIAGLVSLLHYDSIIDLKNVLEEEIHNLRTFELSQSPQSYQVEISSNGECDIERCGKCKYELINNYKYCPECGTKLIK